MMLDLYIKSFLTQFSWQQIVAIPSKNNLNGFKIVRKILNFILLISKSYYSTFFLITLKHY